VRVGSIHEFERCAFAAFETLSESEIGITDIW
jgi:hypothetical protein